MKKDILKAVNLILILVFSSFFPVFADSKNIVYSNSFNFTSNQIQDIQVSLSYEQLQISQIYGDEIVVEIGSNNIKKIPEVNINDGLLTIRSNEHKARLGDKCTVYLYLPQDFYAQTITINNASGNINASTLKAHNAIVINNISGRTDIGICSTELYNVSSVSGNITLQKISAEYFEFSSISGNIFVELALTPLATSKISTTSGKSQLYYPKDSNVDLSAFSIIGSIINSATGIKTTGPEYHYQAGQGGPEISISSISGKIEMIEY